MRAPHAERGKLKKPGIFRLDGSGCVSSCTSTGHPGDRKGGCMVTLVTELQRRFSPSKQEAAQTHGSTVFDRDMGP